MVKKTLIFINYRNEDCLSLANTLAALLKRYFGQDKCFLDRENIDYSKSITEEILRNMHSAKVLLVLIGNGWHLVNDKDNDKRLLNSSDWVRREIEIAREQKKKIIPILSPGVNYSIVTDWLNRKVESLAFMSDLKAFTINSIENDCIKLLDIISKEIKIPVSYFSEKPVVYSKEKDLHVELNRYFPLNQKYKKAKGEIPFVGLDYFKKEDAPLFFGRTSEILKLCKSISNYGLVLLYGHSGVGKSSLMDAGILPRLEKIYNTEYVRRNKLIGYHQQLLCLLKAHEEGIKRLIILDQVEEIYNDKREDWRNESTIYWDLLSKALFLYPSWKFVLVFRSEHYPNIRDFLNDRQIQLTAEQELHLAPLKLDGIQEAILGVANDRRLSNYFKLQVEEPMAVQLSTDLLTDGKKESHIGPLLQYQLRKLWDDAYSKRESDTEWVRLTMDQYKAHRDGTLGELLDDQLARLDQDWKKFLDNGLVLEVLYSYTTEKLTATFQYDCDIINSHSHIDSFLDFFYFLKNKLLLLIDGGTKDNPIARLAHDSLAPLIRQRFQDSNATGQQAWRLVEAKSRMVGLLVTFSESDIETILSGRYGMGKIPDNILNQINYEQEKYFRQKQERVDIAIQTAKIDIEDLQFDKALKNINIAYSENISDKRIWDLAWQLLYPFEQLQKTKALEETMALIGEKEAPFEIENKNLKKYYPFLVKVHGGEFEMGSEESYEDEKPIHKVYLRSFLMGSTPVTWYQYGLFCLLTDRDFPNDSNFGRGYRPVINVNWYDAIDYCNWLSEKLSPIDGIKLENVYNKTNEEVTVDWSKNGFRLPTEAEWEYGAREGGKKVRFGTGIDVADPSMMNFDAGQQLNELNQKWYIKGKGLDATTPVNKYPANILGLHDMSGNVYEWCWDWWYSNLETNFYKISNGALDPVGPDIGERRVIRGGSWQNIAKLCRCSNRWRFNPFYRFNNLGFRVVRVPYTN